MIYGYARISTQKQNIQRQITNISKAYPDADIRTEVYTGKELENRKVFQRLLKEVKTDDIIVFDEVSRMSRNAEEGFNLYQELYNRGVGLVFLKEAYINTDTYKKALDTKISMTGDNVDFILEGINKYLLALAKEQIKLAFNQAQKEVDFLSQRTKDGIREAKKQNKQIGNVKGIKLTTKKSIKAKEYIKKNNYTFGGNLNNEQTWKSAEISKATFYKYKNELLEELKQSE